MIHKAMIDIMKEVKAIGKDSYNQGQRFNFRGIDAVMNHLHPLFAKHGVVIMPEVISERSEDRTTKSGGNLIYRILTIKFRFVASDGSEVSCVTIGEGADSGDKATPKAMAIALKYAVSQAFLLPYDEIDPDATTPEPSKPKAEKPADSGKPSFEFLKAMGEMKKALGKDDYYRIIGEAGFEHANEIGNRGTQKAVYQAMKDQLKANAEAVMKEGE